MEASIQGPALLLEGMPGKAHLESPGLTLLLEDRVRSEETDSITRRLPVPRWAAL